MHALPKHRPVSLLFCRAVGQGQEAAGFPRWMDLPSLRTPLSELVSFARLYSQQKEVDGPMAVHLARSRPPRGTERDFTSQEGFSPCVLRCTHN